MGRSSCFWNFGQKLNFLTRTWYKRADAKIKSELSGNESLVFSLCGLATNIKIPNEQRSFCNMVHLS